MSAPKRVALAFCCLLLGFTLFAVMGTVPTAIHYGLRFALPALEILPLYLLFALPGLLLALPFVLLFKDAEGYRMWMILMIGTFIGPAFLATWVLLTSHGHLSWQAEGSALLMSVWIGFPTTVFYILLLRRLSANVVSRSSLLE